MEVSYEGGFERGKSRSNRPRATKLRETDLERPAVRRGARRAMMDPVTGFEYPEAWVRACRDPGLLPEVERGLALLTADGTVLRRGFTTGTTAAAACKAAILSLGGEREVKGVFLVLPCMIRVEVPARGRGGEGRCVK